MRRVLDLEVTPAQRYLVTPVGQRYREFVNGEFHWVQLSFSKGRSRDIDNSHEVLDPDVQRLANANAIGSQSKRGMHCPVLDIDVPALLVPSSTVGNSHLYIRKPMPWHHYSMLLQTLSYVGILEEGYVGAALERHNETFVRTPWTRK
jgi:hypothetical protein